MDKPRLDTVELMFKDVITVDYMTNYLLDKSKICNIKQPHGRQARMYRIKRLLKFRMLVMAENIY